MKTAPSLQPPTDQQPVDRPAGIDEGRPADRQEPDATPPGAFADLEAMRLPTKFATTLGVKKMPGKVTVGKPRDQFFRIRRGEEWTYRGYILKYQQETYLVDPRVVHLIPPNLIRAVEIFVGVDRNNQVFLLTVGLPGEDGRRNSWQETLATAVEQGFDHWILVIANMSLGDYEIFFAQSKLSDPEWPVHTMLHLIDLAFRAGGKLIQTEDHPVILALQGRV